MKRFCARRSTGRARSSGTTIQPRRQPVIAKYFEKPLITTALSENAATLAAGSP